MSETPPPSYEEALYRNSVRLPGLQVFYFSFLSSSSSKIHLSVCVISLSLCYIMFLLFLLSSLSRFCLFPSVPNPRQFDCLKFSIFFFFLAISFAFKTILNNQTETQTRAVDVTMEDTSLPSLIPTSTPIETSPDLLPNHPQVFNLSLAY